MKKYISIFFLCLMAALLLSSCRSFDRQADCFQEQLNRQERKALETTERLAEVLQGSSFDSVRLVAEADKSVLYYVFGRSGMLYWSDNWLASSHVYLNRFDRWDFRLFDNAAVICRWTHAGQYNILSIIPIKYDYSFENSQLRNVFVEPFSLPDNVLIRQNRAEGGYPIHDADGHYLFSLHENESNEQEQLSADPLQQTRLSDSFSYPSILTRGTEHTILHREAYHFIIISVLFCLLLLAMGIYGVVRSKGISNMRLSSKFQYLIVVILMLSFTCVLFVSVHYTSQRFSNRQREDLETKARYIQKALQDTYPWQLELTPRSTESLNVYLRDLSYTYEVDIHVYDLQGNLIGSSLPQLFDFGILSRHMSTGPFFSELNGISRETIGGVDYLAAYTDFVNANYLRIGYIEVPYYVSSKDQHLALDDFLAHVFPPFLLMMIISVALALFFARRLTRPLMVLSEGMKKFRVGETNEHLEYNHRDEVGQLVEQYNTMVDELEESTSRLARSERESAWRTMARQVAHEINNPLTPMRMKIQQMQRLKAADDPRFDAFFRTAADSLLDQIDQLSHNASAFSSFAKMPEVVATQVDVAAKLSGVINLFKETAEDVDIRYLGADSGIVVKTDAEQIPQVFNNLIKNAIQALEDKPNAEVIVVLKDLSKTVEITISDNGPGIPDDVKDHIFMPNFTTKSTGSGLGLAISKNIVEGSGGKIWFETSPRGTTFYIQLRKC